MKHVSMKPGWGLKYLIKHEKQKGFAEKKVVIFCAVCPLWSFAHHNAACS